MIVVGIKKMRSRLHASLVLFEKIKRIEPLIKRAIAAINKRFERGSENPLLVMYCAWLPKSVILLGIAFTKIALRSNFERKFKE